MKSQFKLWLSTQNMFAKRYEWPRGTVTSFVTEAKEGYEIHRVFELSWLGRFKEKGVARISEGSAIWIKEYRLRNYWPWAVALIVAMTLAFRHLQT